MRRLELISLDELKKAHKDFLNNLPQESIKKTFVKILLIGAIGFILSLVLVVFNIVVLKYNPKSSSGFISLLTSQDLPFVLLAFLFFFKGDIKNVFKQIFTNNSYKSPLLIIGFLGIDLILMISLLSVYFIFFKNPLIIKFLENIIGTHSGPDNISLNYILSMSQSLGIFLIIAFYEEFLFRFTIFRFLRKSGLIFALIISSILFAFTHGSNGFMGAFIFGILIAFYYEYTNNFLGAVIIHAFSNLLIVYYAYYFTFLILQLKIF